ncbi:hypothetical protein B0T22DRAFT_456042 [Podospora appendiculata]|uniref:DUF1275 domain protein n=1 Tax=Podospora appendiculata TaxID=314037 RepID=A0AAE0XLW9_9PEZI|nr:hypothetical protein B0T22DRAFT_456042 [Podospora appendiculata]
MAPDIEASDSTSNSNSDAKPHTSSTTAQNAITNHAGDKKSTTTTLKTRLADSLAQLRDDVSLGYADIPILACCTVSGLCDSVAFNATGTFASMQTGNTIFLALGASSLPANQPTLWLRALVSILAFLLGCLTFSKSRHLHPQRKATLSISFLIQACFIFTAAALAQTGAVPAFGKALIATSLTDAQLAQHEADEESPLVFIPLALLAFQFGGQIVTSRILGFNEVPTNVLTSLYCDLLSDPGLLKGVRENPKRNRRVVAIVLIVLGGVVGGWLQHSRAGMSAALWTAGGIKFVIAVAWVAWRSKAVPKSVAVGGGEK